jgi:hypothetical protein
VALDPLANFGVERSMLADEFPGAGRRVDAVSRMLQDLPLEDGDWSFWRNAAAFYRL